GLSRPLMRVKKKLAEFHKNWKKEPANKLPACRHGAVAFSQLRIGAETFSLRLRQMLMEG
ncbi:MAG: hypothetical protein ABIA67_02035, partial [Candidatus Margulisiibacteriota bacterium]